MIIITEEISKIIYSRINFAEIFGYLIAGILLMILVIRIILDENLKESTKFLYMDKFMKLNYIGSSIVGIIIFIISLNMEYKSGFNEIETVDNYLSQTFKPEQYLKFKKDNLDKIITDAISDNTISIYEWCLIRDGYKRVISNIYEPEIILPTPEEIGKQKDKIKEKYQEKDIK